MHTNTDPDLVIAYAEQLRQATERLCQTAPSSPTAQRQFRRLVASWWRRTRDIELLPASAAALADSMREVAPFIGSRRSAVGVRREPAGGEPEGADRAPVAQSSRRE